MLRASGREILHSKTAYIQDLNVVLRGQPLSKELRPLLYPSPIHMHEVQDTSAFACSNGCLSALYLRQGLSYPAGISVWEDQIAGLALSG
jgi:hypothetical protein